MSFSFNWSGTSVPLVKRRDGYANLRDDAEAVGKGAAGMDRFLANREYANLIEGRNKDVARIREIKAEIDRLENRNSEIESALAVQTTTVTEQPAPVYEPELSEATPINVNEALGKQAISGLQADLGTTADGIWGPKSRAAFAKKYPQDWTPLDELMSRWY